MDVTECHVCSTADNIPPALGSRHMYRHGRRMHNKKWTETPWCLLAVRDEMQNVQQNEQNTCIHHTHPQKDRNNKTSKRKIEMDTKWTQSWGPLFDLL